ncbi:hypothetical protein [Desulfobulbus sp.]|uniref:hypothetical protein n=1 Tax=Desulfobulbus sp. TaxID=895 RepID=UPI00286EBD85|nr:hypothetical protein [Desulfobulbus sp.]
MKKGLSGMGRSGIGDHAEVNKRLRAVKICPVTNGLPTTMTLEGFQAACEKCREQDRAGWDEQHHYKHTWCDTCQGKKRPRELRIESLAKLAGKRKMAKRRPKKVAASFGQSRA